MFSSPSTLPLPLLALLPSLTAAVIITQTFTSTYTAAISSPASTIIQSLSPSPTQTSEQYTSDSTFRSTILNSTNTYRTQHNASSLSWNASLATYALTWAQNCNWAHSHGPNGENLAENYPNVTVAVDSWGDERKHYDFNNGGDGFTEGTGHFSQLVWKATSSVGCARVDCEGNKVGGNARGWFVVCEYFPVGNVRGQFREEVQSEVDKIKTEGKDAAAEYMAYIHDKMNRAGRKEWSWGPVLVLGLGVLMGSWL